MPIAPLATLADMERLRDRFITGSDDVEFCRRISALLDDGYILHGPPTLAHNGETMIAGQAVILPTDEG
jgi:hypothetical protein